LFPNLGRMRLGGVGHGFDEAGRQRHGEYSATSPGGFSIARDDEAREGAVWGIFCHGARRVRHRQRRRSAGGAVWGIFCHGARRVRRSGWRVIG
jgi:hypothetical protein